jgi:hypothetical protein
MKKILSILALVVIVLLVGYVLRKPAYSSPLAGDWEITEQYVWNESTQAWDPGLVDEQDVPTSDAGGTPVTIADGADPDICTFVKEETTGEYLTFKPGGCFKVQGSMLTLVDYQTGVEYPITVAWQKIGDDKIEFIVTGVSSETGRDKAIYVRE